MKAVIKQKVHSALCNAEAVDSYNKAMYEGKRMEKDRETGEYVTIEDPNFA